MAICSKVGPNVLRCNVREHTQVPGQPPACRMTCCTCTWQLQVGSEAVLRPSPQLTLSLIPKPGLATWTAPKQGATMTPSARRHSGTLCQVCATMSGDADLLHLHVQVGCGCCQLQGGRMISLFAGGYGQH